MGFRDDGSTLIEINSARGLDGSGSITEIPDGYCEEIENADISSKGVIRCRKGYSTLIDGCVRTQQYGRTADTAIVPVSEYLAGVTLTDITMDKWVSKGYASKYGDVTVEQLNYMAAQFRFVDSDSPIFKSNAIGEAYAAGVGTTVCKLDDYSAVVSKAVDAAAYRENSFPMNLICADTGYTMSISKSGGYIYVTATSEERITIPTTAKFDSVGFGEEAVTVSLLDENTIRFQFTDTCFGFIGTTPILTPLLGVLVKRGDGADFSVDYSNAPIQGMAAFTAADGNDVLAVVKAGKLFAYSDNMYLNGALPYYSLSLGTSYVSASFTTITKNSEGNYVLTRPKPATVTMYTAGDRIFLTGNGGSPQYEFTLVSLTEDGSNYYFTLNPEGSYAASIVLQVEAIHFVKSSSTTYAILSGVELSSDLGKARAYTQKIDYGDITQRRFIYLGNHQWMDTRGLDSRIPLYYLGTLNSSGYYDSMLEIGRLDPRPDTSENVPVVALNAAAYMSHPTGGVHAYTGNNISESSYAEELVNLSKLLPPVVQSWRSLPGTKSAFECPIGENNERTAVRLQFVFTYQVVDGLGRIFESGKSEPADGIFFAEPTEDGTPYTQRIEVLMRPPVFDFGSSWVGMRLVAYLYTTFTRQDGTAEDAGYIQYETFMPAPDTYSTSDALRLAMTLGKTPITSIKDNPPLDEQQGTKKNFSAPRAKLMTVHDGRIVAANVVVPARTEIDVGDFTTGGNPPFIKSSDFCTVPLGLKEFSGVFRAPFSNLEIDTGYDYRTTAVKWWDTRVSSTDFIVAYADNSDKFTAQFYPYIAQASGEGVGQYIFRNAGTREDFSFPLTREIFVDNAGVVASGASLHTFNFVASEKCKEVLTAAGTAPAIDAASIFHMAQVSETVTEAAVENKDAFIDYANEDLVYYVKLKDVQGSTIRVAGPYLPDIVTALQADTLLLAFRGPGNLYNLTYDGTKYLSFDNDLLFVPETMDIIENPTSPGTYIQDAVTLEDGSKYFRYKLHPVQVSAIKNDAGDTVFFVEGIQRFAREPFFDLLPNKLVLRADAGVDNKSYEIKLFAAPMRMELEDSGAKDTIHGRTGAVIKSSAASVDMPPVVFAGFNNPSSEITFSLNPAPLKDTTLLDDIAVDDFICLELDEADAKLLPAQTPIKPSRTYRVLRTTATEFVVDGLSDETLKQTLRNFSLTTTGSMSRVVKLKKLFAKTGNGEIRIPIDTTSPTSYYTTSGKSFLLVRGEEDASTSLRASGHYLFEYESDVSGDNYLLTAGSNGQANLFGDYSNITGVKYSHIVSIVNPMTATPYPWPIPVPLTARSKWLEDLASPLFGNSNVAGSVYHTVSRRIASLGGFISEGSDELGVITESGKVYSIGTANRWEDSEAASITVKNNNATQSFTPPVRYRNRLQWTSAVRATQQNSTLMPMFKRDYIQDIISGDDSEITGITSVQNALLVTKRNGMFRGTFDVDGNLTLQRIQTTVGAYGMYNLPATLSYVYFLNDTGVYFTDGNEVTNVFKLSRRYKNNVIKSTELFSKCAGYVDHLNKVVHLGVPYQSRFNLTQVGKYAQFAYSYNDGVNGWSVNTGIPATCWARFGETDIFGTVDGRVCCMLTKVDEPRSYSDDGMPIVMALKTKYMDGGDKVRFKFYRNALFQFGTEGDVNFTTYYATNYNATEYPFQTYAIAGDSSDRTEWRRDKFLKTLRETVASRVGQLSFTLTAAVKYASAPIYGIFLEGFKTNTRLINQKNTPGNTRT